MSVQHGILRWRRYGMAGLICLFCAACSAGEAPTPRSSSSTAPPAYGDTLVEGTIGEASTLIPILASDSASHSVAGLVYNGLIKYDKNLTIVGDLAESYQVSPDGLTITFKLRKNVTWHDGKPFTSRDVLYTYRVIIDPKTPTAYSEDFKQVAAVTAPDAYTIVVRYAKPYAPALASWGVAILPSHLLEGQDITKSPLARKPVGTGPFRFKEWVAGQKVVLEANKNYFEGRPYLDRYVFRLIPDTSTMYMELKAGGVDQMGLTPVQFARQTDTPRFKAAFNKYRYPSNGYLYLGYNLRHPLFKDVRVRRAMTAAINKDELIQGVLFGMGQKANGPMIPGRWAHNPNVKDIPFNPAYAKQLLAEAGWKPGDDGFLQKDGRPLRFTILTNQGNQQRLMTAQIIQQRLKQVGVDVRIRIVEWAAFLKEFIDKGNFEVVLLAWMTSQDPDMYDIWHSSKTKPGELNFIGYNNQEVDRLLEEGRSTFDIDKRKKAYYRIQDILAEEQPYTFLYVPDALPVVSSRIHGIETAPAGIGHNLIKWYVPKLEQRY
ncbi:peptide/nickel transport system substrate-binding protein [Trichlorobacter thiogenes]|uniref:Peptide/nickel transport system substrate-binding protein n=1 Tax=Trichlorobacter thiogenes TaxID=115783 RepID=A0A1T4Q1Z5_9BACT|nr:peptide-binding protein [Trichlorobacter thiogenes]SJZ97258.1 peptide/nickel transport system substrate-binding protein [Trichlorobacter thiogenes]